MKQQNIVFNNAYDELDKSVANTETQLIDLSDSSSLHDSSIEIVSTVNNDLIEILEPNLTENYHTIIEDIPVQPVDRDREKIIR